MKQLCKIAGWLSCWSLCVQVLAGQTPRLATLNGYVRDASTGETLIGCSIVEMHTQKGTSSNEYGFFSLSLPPGQVELRLAYPGFSTRTYEFWLKADSSVNLLMETSTLEEVVITAEQKPKLGTLELSVGQLQALPALGGERDLLRSLQLLPGVQGGNEGTTGLYVRGGGADQNLMLLDDVPLYNVSHLFGFFSTFNADAIKHITLIKGGFPAQYGGRLSSVLDIRTKEGNLYKFSGKGSLGIVAANATLEGPLQKGKSSFIISARRTFLDLFTRPFTAVQRRNEGGGGSLGYFFYDLNAKANYIFSPNDRLILSVYAGKDRFQNRLEEVDEQANDRSEFEQAVSWANTALALRWNHLFSPRLFVNTTAIFGRYHLMQQHRTKYELLDPDEYRKDEFLNEYQSNIQDVGLKTAFEFYPDHRHLLRWGIQGVHHRFLPGIRTYRQQSNQQSFADSSQASTPIPAWEARAYLGHEWKIGAGLQLSSGLHASAFGVGDTQYVALEPRFILNWQLSPVLHFQAAYTRMRQYLHLLFNTGVGFPLELWVPPTDKVPPQTAWQLAGGLGWKQHTGWEVSLEGYYKNMQGLIEFKEGASFLIESNSWEEQVAPNGRGWSYGAELLIRKQSGRLNGWLGYTFSRTYRQFKELNAGKKFPFKYDRTHDVDLVLMYKCSPAIEMSATWVYSTGNAFTMVEGFFPTLNYPPQPNQFIALNEPTIPPPTPGIIRPQPTEGLIYGSRNGARMPAYHRLDYSICFYKQKRTYKRSWIISIYNLYNRKNPYYIFFEYQNEPEGNSEPRGKFTQVSLFPIIPSVSYQIEF